MSGIPKIEIVESVENLKELLKQQKSSLGFAKVQSLYLLKIQQVETVRHLSIIIGRTERTLHRWLNLDREGGIERLLSEGNPPRRPKKISINEAAMLPNEFNDPEGFKSYKEIHLWFSEIRKNPVSYSTIYRLVKLELRAKLKIPRPRNPKQLPGEVEAFKIGFAERLKAILEKESEKVERYGEVCFWCEDESRFGCHTIPRRKITIFGVKPTGKFQYNFQCFWLYGTFEPRTGRSFLTEFSHLDGDCFEEYLSLFSRTFPNQLHILQVDNAPAHIAGYIDIPDNVILLYQPSCCPEVNSAERVWLYLKNCLAWETFESLDTLRGKLDNLLNRLTCDMIGYLTGWSWILEALCLSGI